MKGKRLHNPSPFLEGTWEILKRCHDGDWFVEKIEDNKSTGEFGFLDDKYLQAAFFVEEDPRFYTGSIPCHCGSDSIKWNYHSDWCPKYEKK